MNPNEPPKDHAEEPGDDPYDYGHEPGADAESDPGAGSGARSSPFAEKIRSKDTWLRLLFMVIMAVLFWAGLIVGVIIVILQFFWVLFTGETKREFSAVGRQLAEYGKEIALFMTFNTDERPFPFGRDWPQA